MAHHLGMSGYARLVERLNRFPQGAPPSGLLFRILSLLMSEEEAGKVAALPLRPFTAKKAARAWKTTEAEAEKVLQRLAGRGLLLDTERGGRSIYVLPPPMAGFFEFSMMRVRTDVDQKALSELLYQYLNVEEEFIRALFTEGETQLGRVLVHEPSLPEDGSLQVLSWERASEVVRGSSCIAVGTCYCRHKMEHLGRACDAPREICMTFGSTAESLTRHGIARRMDASEGMDLLRRAWEGNLVQFGENVREQVSFICHCCGCCCEAMIAARRFAILHPVHTTGFLPRLDREGCSGCGRCVALCPVEAMTLVSANDPVRPSAKKALLREEVCLGCGICVRGCERGCLSLVLRGERVITPANSAHRTVLMAVERGKLQNLVFDNQVLASHRALAALLGAVLRLPPVKRAMASRQMRSRYLEGLLRRFHP